MRKAPLRVVFIGGASPRFSGLLASLPPTIHPIPCRDWDDVGGCRGPGSPELVVRLPGAPPAPFHRSPVPHCEFDAEDTARDGVSLEARLFAFLRDAAGPETRILGRSPVMARLRGLLITTARTSLPLMITGENGTGKDLAATVAHRLSPRCAEPMVPVNCGAVPPGLAETEFFGCVRGAFTGAENRTGFCQQALGGTLFLDEVGELSPEIQAKLLRVLENREVRRVGSPRTEETDFRLICATNRDLSTEVKAGRFREDLYYRINVLPLRIPPLRERMEDLPLLAEHFLDASALGLKEPVRVGPAALGRMAEYHWPGNLRQLRNVLFRAAVLHGVPELGAEHIDWET